MQRIKLTIEYDGTAYAGWQVQTNGLGVQEVVEVALEKLLGTFVRLHSASRTDAGVHSRGMVAHFDTDRDLQLGAYREGLNRFLPEDVSIRRAESVAGEFHSRFSNSGKWYRYSLCLEPVRSPLHARTSWLVKDSLDIALMREAGQNFIGCYDFSAFRASGCTAKTTRKEITAVDLTEQEPLLLVDVRGSGFLRNMVRIMVGTLLEVGLHLKTPEDIKCLLSSGDRHAAGRTAPAHGLCLMKIDYQEGYSRIGTDLHGGMLNKS